MALDSLRELDRRVADNFGLFHDFEEEEGELYGYQIVRYDNCKHEIEDRRIIPRFSADMSSASEVEQILKEQGTFEDYTRALEADGVNIRSASPEQRCRAALLEMAGGGGEDE
jgi:hypothetical protein